MAEETGVTGENNYKSMLYRVHIAMSGIHGWGEHHFQGVDQSVSTVMKSHQLFY
jgi:hypothetical protein